MISQADRFGATWWGRLWINGLEKLGDDYENRLPRGKKYAEDGHVSHFSVQPGEIQARVHGRKTYNVLFGCSLRPPGVITPAVRASSQIPPAPPRRTRQPAATARARIPPLCPRRARP